MLMNINKLTKIINSSADIEEAAKKANMTRQGIHWRLSNNNLKIVRRLKVVKKDQE